MTVPLRTHSFRIHPAPGRLSGSSGPVVTAVIRSGRGYRVIRRVRLAQATGSRRASLWQRILSVLHPSADAELLYDRQSWRRALHQERLEFPAPLMLGGQLTFLPGTSRSRYQRVTSKGGL
ncbi:hypothetical protein GCM10008955_21580 [Deinococcus malanensis]|uniref:Uncharacterized protein n=2 Tax=Deinococcus malanensis TaxID=1706855 RepID=A0ABQ2EVD4_9DEIO|nr:hypothetical protein [Deinococcus malanensis]GGK27454.1 hypothetical protein GCM10008955_21580 [Deinococcus malanensis]